MPGNGLEPDGEDRRLLELVGDVCGLLDLAELRYGLIDAVHRVLPSDYVSLNDIGPGPDDVVALMRPERDQPFYALWRQHAHENPLLRHHQRTLDGRAYRFSDVCSSEELHALPLYREVYAPLGVEHQLAFTLPAGPERVLALALSRSASAGDYSDAERDFANRARPYLIQAYLNAIAFQSLRLRAVGAVSGAPRLESLRAAGLTPREADALRLLALGKSNHHIAIELGISPRTVGKHLERGFRKLGVCDRSSAAGRVWELTAAAMRSEAAQGASSSEWLRGDGAAGAATLEHPSFARQQAEREHEGPDR